MSGCGPWLDRNGTRSSRATSNDRSTTGCGRASPSSRSGGRADSAIAALIRPADPAHDEDENAWLDRAREAAAHGPLGQHTHWTAPHHARPTGGDPGARVLQEGAAAPRARRSADPLLRRRLVRRPRRRRGLCRARVRRLHRHRVPSSVSPCGCAPLRPPGTRPRRAPVGPPPALHSLHALPRHARPHGR